MGNGAGLATAFYRIYVLHALVRGPARPGALLSALHARDGALPLPTGAFTRAVQQLLDAGLVVAGPMGALQLTPFAEREREDERAVWERVCAIVGRLLAGDVPLPEPPTDGGVPLRPAPHEPVADAYRERVVVAEVREAIRRARDGRDAFAVVLAHCAVAHAQPARARAMLHRALRETLSRARSTFGADAVALRCGPSGVLLIVPERDADVAAELLRARLGESLAAMTATVRAFAGARSSVRVGLARWSRTIATSGELLERADAALALDEEVRSAA